MKTVIQRVSQSSVEVEGRITGQIGKGLMILLGVGHEDTEEQADYLADKIAAMRIFEDENDKMNLSIKDIGGEFLVISQFTLYADCRKGNRPSFVNAGKPDEANRLYEYFCQRLRDKGFKVDQGVFGAHMNVSLINDGPVTIVLER